ncbi:MAG: hypothetical protein ACYTG3_13405 [Planctomycetota bacterium]|jgi:hypothetical protein
MKKRASRVAPVQVVFDNPPLALRHWLCGLAIFLALAVAGFVVGGRTNTVVGLPDADRYLLLEATNDDYAYIYIRATNHLPSESDILIFGTSAPREALEPDAKLTHDLAALNGPSGRILNLTSSDQTFLETLHLLTLVDLRPDQTVVIVRGPTAFAPTDPNDDRLKGGAWLQSPLLLAEEFQAEVPRLREWLEPLARRQIALRSQRKMTNRFFRQWIGGKFRRAIYDEPPRVHVNYCETHPAGDLDYQNRHRRQVRGRMEWTFDSHCERVYIDLRTLVRYVHSRGARFVSIESPIMKGDRERTFGEWWERYEAFNKRLEEETGATHTYLPFNNKMDAALFVDSRHVSAEGRAFWSNQFVAGLSRQMAVPRKELAVLENVPAASRRK